MVYLIEMLPMLISILVGMFAEHSKQKSADAAQQTELLIMQLKASDDSADKAASRSVKGSSWSRKFIVQSVIGAMFLFPMLLTILNFFAPALGLEQIAISIPKDIIEGRGIFDMLFGGGGEKVIEYIKMYSFVITPTHIALAQTITGFYFGSSAMRRN